MSIPEIQAYRGQLGRSISLKMGLGSILGSSASISNNVQEEASQEDVESFFGGF